MDLRLINHYKWVLVCWGDVCDSLLYKLNTDIFLYCAGTLHVAQIGQTSVVSLEMISEHTLYIQKHIQYAVLCSCDETEPCTSAR